jgi:hypothetical protein
MAISAPEKTPFATISTRMVRISSAKEWGALESWPQFTGIRPQAQLPPSGAKAGNLVSPFSALSHCGIAVQPSRGPGAVVTPWPPCPGTGEPWPRQSVAAASRRCDGPEARAVPPWSQASGQPPGPGPSARPASAPTGRGPNPPMTPTCSWPDRATEAPRHGPVAQSG